MVYDMIAKTAIVNFFFASLIIVIPVISKGDATHIGFMMSAIGVGMLLSSVMLSVKKITMDTKKILILSFIFMGLSFLALGVSKNSYLSMIALFFIGVTLNIFNITIVSLYQRALPLEVLGKIMSFMSAISLSFYKKKYKDIETLTSFKDWQKIPILQRDELQKNSYPSSTKMLKNGKFKSMIVSSTGGSSGIARYTVLTHKEWNKFALMQAKSLKGLGISKKDSVANLLTAGSFWPAYLIQYFSRKNRKLFKRV